MIPGFVFFFLLKNIFYWFFHIIIMEPPGVFIVYEYFFTFFIHKDTDMRAGEVGNLLSWPGLNPGISVL